MAAFASFRDGTLLDDYVSHVSPSISVARRDLVLPEAGDQHAGSRIVYTFPSGWPGSIEFGAVRIGRLVATVEITHLWHDSVAPPVMLKVFPEYVAFLEAGIRDAVSAPTASATETSPSDVARLLLEPHDLPGAHDGIAVVSENELPPVDALLDGHARALASWAGEPFDLFGRQTWLVNTTVFQFRTPAGAETFQRLVREEPGLGADGVVCGYNTPVSRLDDLTMTLGADDLVVIALACGSPPNREMVWISLIEGRVVNVLAVDTAIAGVDQAYVQSARELLGAQLQEATTGVAD